ncbi:MAG: hypothetical protein KGL39_13175 [Patescibacteria group bacterium]|nr:hypothetical protein [Patescibacteria group bacterium]
MKQYRLTIGKRVSGNNRHDWYSGQLEYLATYGDANEAKAHLKDGNPDGSEQWPEVYDNKGNRMALQGRKLVRMA